MGGEYGRGRPSQRGGGAGRRGEGRTGTAQELGRGRVGGRGQLLPSRCRDREQVGAHGLGLGTKLGLGSRDSGTSGEKKQAGGVPGEEAAEAEAEGEIGQVREERDPGGGGRPEMGSRVGWRQRGAGARGGRADPERDFGVGEATAKAEGGSHGPALPLTPPPPLPPWQRDCFLASAISAHPFPEGGGSSHPLLTSPKCPPSPSGPGAEIASGQDVEGIRGQRGSWRCLGHRLQGGGWDRAGVRVVFWRCG